MGLPGGVMLTGLGERDLGFAPPLGQFLSLGSNAKGQPSLQFKPWVPGGDGEGSTERQVSMHEGHSFPTGCRAWRFQEAVSGHFGEGGADGLLQKSGRVLVDSTPIERLQFYCLWTTYI